MNILMDEFCCLHSECMPQQPTMIIRRGRMRHRFAITSDNLSGSCLERIRIRTPNFGQWNIIFCKGILFSFVLIQFCAWLSPSNLPGFYQHRENDRGFCNEAGSCSRSSWRLEITALIDSHRNKSFCSVIKHTKIIYNASKGLVRKSRFVRQIAWSRYDLQDLSRYIVCRIGNQSRWAA